jgi:hypothetical protein
LLPEDDVGSTVVERILSFFIQAQVGLKFPEANFVFDVYLDRAGRAWLLDFGPLPELVPSDEEIPWSAEEERCSLLLQDSCPHELLSWEDLYRNHQPGQAPRYLVVESHAQAQKMGNLIGSHRVPIELVTGELTQDIIDQAKAQLDEMAA